jgi:LuxR family maltose regulon positive regulatory protein
MNMIKSTLLVTKLYIPPVRPEVVTRSRLIERLDDVASCTVTLVSAPAGFGKTTLLSAWAHAEDRAGRCKVAWVSLAAGDNDIVRFLGYVVAALQTVWPDVGTTTLGMLDSLQPPSLEVALTPLINDMTGIAEPTALVLDDYHLITAQPIHEAVGFLLDYLPPQIHLIIAARTDPSLPLGRLRGRAQLNELRAADLRFTTEETALLLNEAMGLDVLPQDAALLEARTEGWVVGLQLAALSLKGRDRASVTNFIAALRGNNRYILDYLTEEVLDRQPETVQQFLLQTSILDRLTPSLCDAVTGRDDSVAMLRRLDSGNLFVVPLDESRQWYRYHHLFADLLRSRLEYRCPDWVALLHRRASEWYEREGQIAEAAHHALAADDVARATHLIEQNVLYMIHHGQSASLTNWLERLSNQVIRSRPWLCVAYAWVLAYDGRLDAVGSLLKEAEQALVVQKQPLDWPEMSEEEQRHIAGYIALIRAYTLILSGNFSAAAILVQRAQNCLVDAGVRVRSFSATLLGLSLGWEGDFENACQILGAAVDTSASNDDPATAVVALCDMAGLMFAQGRLHDSLSISQDAMKRADEYARCSGRQLPAKGYAHLRVSQVLREWNELKGAVHHAYAAVESVQGWERAEIAADAHKSLAITLQELGDLDGAREAFREAGRVARCLSDWYADDVVAREALLDLQMGYIAAAIRWAEREKQRISGRPLSFQEIARSMALLRILVAQGELDEALALASGVLELAEALGAVGTIIRALAIQAQILQAQGYTDRALNA